MRDLAAELPRPGYSLAHPGGDLGAWEKAGLASAGLGLFLLFAALFWDSGSMAESARALWLAGAWGAVVAGGLAFGLHKHLADRPGVRNRGVASGSLTARGALGWTLGVVLTGGYVVLYWFPELLEGLIRLHDPLSRAMRGKAADQWFVYGTCYTVAVVVMGAKALAKYRHSRYQLARIAVIIVAQLGFAYLLPSFFARIGAPEVYLSYLWPLAYDKLFPGTLAEFLRAGNLGYFIAGWFLVGTLAATPALTYFYGKRWYCSWICGCGGLANTAGDAFRQNSDKSLRAWRVERWTIHLVLVWIVGLTALLWFAPLLPGPVQGVLGTIKQWYGFLIGAVFAGVVGVGFYPILGTRVWCRFGCPMAAILGLLQRFCSRFRITTNGAQCISCGNCSKYCEMGIDVRSYAQRGQDVVRASCVGCGICATVCPRGVLSLENGPPSGRRRLAGGLSMLGDRKAR
jgi:Pyruvate/2-oxoacid:ferredoxin oxidoreductase delta subunit